MPRLERITTPAEVKEDLREAIKIVAELDPPMDLRLVTFQLVAQALAQRAVAEHPVAGLTVEQLRGLRAG